MPELHAYRVGQLYNDQRTTWPEAGQYQFRAGGHELLLFWRSPSEREVRDVARGDAEFALYVAPPLLVFLYRFGRMDWSDAPYSWHLVPAAERTLPEPAHLAEPHALLSVVLVDAESGIIRSLRALSMQPAFTAALSLAIRDQAAEPWDTARYDAALAELYRRYPHSDNLAARAQSRFLSSAQRRF